MHPLRLITENILQKKFTSNVDTMNFSLHWQLKMKVATELSGTAGPREVLVPYKAYITQNMTGLLEETRFLSFWLTCGNINSSLQQGRDFFTVPFPYKSGSTKYQNSIPLSETGIT